jgi:hypothetical protein
MYRKQYLQDNEDIKSLEQETIAKEAKYSFIRKLKVTTSTVELPDFYLLRNRLGYELENKYVISLYRALFK